MRAKKRKALWKRIVIGAGAVLLVVLVGAVVMVNRFFDEAYLEDLLEDEISSRVTMGDVRVSWLSFPTMVSLENVHLDARPGDLRAAGASVRVERIDLGVDLWELLQKRIEISGMTVHGAEVRGTWYENGDSSLEALFESPDEEKKKARRARFKKSGVKSAGDGEMDDEKLDGFNVFDQGDFVAALGGFSMENCRADIVIEKSGLRLRGSGLHLDMDAIEIDPKRLQDTDMVKLQLGGLLELESTEGWQYGELQIDGRAHSRLFNIETGNLEPDVEGEFDLADSSWLNTRIPVISETWQELNALEAIGLRMDPLPETAKFGRSEAVAAHYHAGKVTVRKALSLWVADWEVAVLENSWLQTETDLHQIEAEVLASRSTSDLVAGLLGTALEYLPREARESVTKEMKNQLFRGDRLLVRLRSTEDLSDPKICLIDGIPDFAKAAEKAGKRLLEEKAGSLLDGLFGK